VERTKELIVRVAKVGLHAVALYGAVAQSALKPRMACTTPRPMFGARTGQRNIRKNESRKRDKCPCRSPTRMRTAGILERHQAHPSPGPHFDSVVTIPYRRRHRAEHASSNRNDSNRTDRKNPPDGGKGAVLDGERSVLLTSQGPFRRSTNCVPAPVGIFDRRTARPWF